MDAILDALEGVCEDMSDEEKRDFAEAMEDTDLTPEQIRELFNNPAQTPEEEQRDKQAQEAFEKIQRGLSGG